MCEAVERLVEAQVSKREAKVKREAMREGKAEGMREGKAKGMREGKAETMLETAKRMLESGMLALKDIARFSGLSLPQVKRLQASLA